MIVTIKKEKQMKKIISLVLAVLMLSMVMTACKNDGTGTESSTPADSIPDAPASGTDTTADGTDATAPETDPADGSDSLVFTECDEEVYVVDVKMLNLRTTADFDDDSAVAATVAYGTKLRRIAKNDVWSKVIYDNAEYFVSTKYLSTEQPDSIVFTDCEETVYVLQDANYRSIPSKADSAIVDTIAKGKEVKRTGIAYDTENDPEGLGWSRVEIEGKVYYMRNSVLTTIAPEAAETPAATEATPAATETAPVVDEH